MNSYLKALKKINDYNATCKYRYYYVYTPLKGLEIKGVYDKYSDFIMKHNVGKVGEAYLVEENLYVWDSERNKWINTGTLKGDKGDKGDGISLAYGIKFSNEVKEVDLNKDTDTNLSFNETGVSYNVDTSNSDSLVIKEEGVYNVSYLFNATLDKDADITLTLRKNDILIAQASNVLRFYLSKYNIISNSFIVKLDKNDKITLSVKSSDNVKVSFKGEVNSLLSINKIS